MTLVLDASLTLSWFFEDEATEATDRIHEQLANGLHARCPAHWPLEVANSLLVAERRKRIQPSSTAQFLNLLSRYRVWIEPARRISGETLLPLAREHELSLYDAAYLDLAMRTGADLGTLDEDLRQAACRVGITLLPEEIQRSVS